MGQTAVLRPDVSYAVGYPRVKRAEEPLHYTVVEYIFVYAALALTIISLIDYLVKNKKVLSDGSSK